MLFCLIVVCVHTYDVEIYFIFALSFRCGGIPCAHICFVARARRSTGRHSEMIHNNQHSMWSDFVFPRAWKGFYSVRISFNHVRRSTRFTIAKIHWCDVCYLTESISLSLAHVRALRFLHELLWFYHPSASTSNETYKKSVLFDILPHLFVHYTQHRNTCVVLINQIINDIMIIAPITVHFV